MKTQAIIPAAGQGDRLGADRPKALVKLNGKPLVLYAIEAFERSSLIDSVIVVVPVGKCSEFREIFKSHSFAKIKDVVEGGKTRGASVRKGLKACDDDTKMIAVHDGARPFVTAKMIDAAVDLCAREGAVVVAVPVKPTIKKVERPNLVVTETLDREALWEVQTPQVFKKELLEQAYVQAGDITLTDDAALVEKLGITIKVLKGDYRNLKVTTQEDLVMAEAFLKL